MAAIDGYLQTIIAATYGRQVRQAIHDAIAQCYSDVSNPTLKSDAFYAAINRAIQEGTLAALTLDDNSVLENMIASGAISTLKLADGSVTNPKLATDAVTTGKIANKAVTKAKLGDDVLSIVTDAETINAQTRALLREQSDTFVEGKEDIAEDLAAAKQQIAFDKSAAIAAINQAASSASSASDQAIADINAAKTSALEIISDKKDELDEDLELALEQIRFAQQTAINRVLATAEPIEQKAAEIVALTTNAEQIAAQALQEASNTANELAVMQNTVRQLKRSVTSIPLN